MFACEIDIKFRSAEMLGMMRDRIDAEDGRLAGKGVEWGVPITSTPWGVTGRLPRMLRGRRSGRRVAISVSRRGLSK
jgi:hypothetical protein